MACIEALFWQHALPSSVAAGPPKHTSKALARYSDSEDEAEQASEATAARQDSGSEFGFDAPDAASQGS